MRPTKRIFRRPLWWLAAGILIAIVASSGWLLTHRQHANAPAAPYTVPSATTDSSKTTSDTIRFIATGDMLPHDTVNEWAKTTAGYDYKPFFSKVAPYLKADISFCNQEAPSSPHLPTSGYPTFNAPSAFASDLSAEGCNLINLANNHADDKGQTGINDTLDVWSHLPTLAVAGTAKNQASQNTVAYFTVRGVRFAFLSYAQCSNNTSVSNYGLNIFSQTLAKRHIDQAKTKSDIIIAAMHSCDENRATPDSWQTSAAKFFADNGVNIVVGTGPHWLQPVDELPRAGGGTTVVWYSLGNFLSTQEDINGLIGGIAVMNINATNKSVTSIGFLPTYMHYEWTPQQKASEDLLARKNLMIYPLDQAAKPLARSQNNTTVSEQTARVTKLMKTFNTPITVYTTQTFPHL